MTLGVPLTRSALRRVLLGVDRVGLVTRSDHALVLLRHRYIYAGVGEDNFALDGNGRRMLDRLRKRRLS